MVKRPYNKTKLGNTIYTSSYTILNCVGPKLTIHCPKLSDDTCPFEFVNMPLTSANRVERALPVTFAHSVKDHIRKRRGIYQKCGATNIFINTDDEGISGEKTLQIDEENLKEPEPMPFSHSRLTPDMEKLNTKRFSSGGSDSENSSTVTTPSSTPTQTPQSRTVPSPRCMPLSFHESPRPLSGGNSQPCFTISPRKPRTSPRTTCSLDNVDLWEEDSDSDAESGSVINLSATVDMSDLRRSRSPIICKRNKTCPSTENNQTKEHLLDNRVNHFGKRSKARMNRRLRQLFPQVSKKQLSEKPDAIPEENSKEVIDKIPNIAESQSLVKQRKIYNTDYMPKSPAANPNSIIQANVSSLHADKPTKKCNEDERLGDNILLTEDLNDKYEVSLLGRNNDHEKCRSDANKQKGLSQLHRRRKQKVVKFQEHKYSNKLTTYQTGSTHVLPTELKQVKFNSFVTVRRDDENSLDFLKRSTNTARDFKLRYLRNATDENTCSEMAHKTTTMYSK